MSRLSQIVNANPLALGLAMFMAGYFVSGYSSMDGSQTPVISQEKLSPPKFNKVIANIKEAQAVTLNESVSSVRLKKMFSKTLSGLDLYDIHPSAAKGIDLFEIYTSDGIFYSDKQGSYIFKGELISTEDGANITRVQEKYLQLLESLDADDVIGFSKTATDTAKKALPKPFPTAASKVLKRLVEKQKSKASAKTAGIQAEPAEKQGKRRWAKIGFGPNGEKLKDTDKLNQVIKMASIIPKDRTINYPAEDEKIELFVFSDYTCGVCRKVHKDIPTLNKAGISVRYLFYPRILARKNTQRSNIVVDNMTSAWCAPNQRKALDELYSKRTIESYKCENLPTDIAEKRGKSPVVSHFSIGGLFSASGTPFGFTSEGGLFEGYSTARSMISKTIR